MEIEQRTVYASIALVVVCSIGVWKAEEVLSERLTEYKKQVVTDTIDQKILRAKIRIDRDGTIKNGKNLSQEELLQALTLCTMQTQELQSKVDTIRIALE